MSNYFKTIQLIFNGTKIKAKTMPALPKSQRIDIFNI